LHAQLTSALLAASSSAFEITGKKKASKFNIPSWKSVVKSKHQIAKAPFWVWVNCNRPKTGGVYRNMIETKKDFIHSLRHCRKDVDIHKANSLAAALQADKTSKTFRQKVNNKSRSPSLPTWWVE